MSFVFFFSIFTSFQSKKEKVRFWPVCDSLFKHLELDLCGWLSVCLWSFVFQETSLLTFLYKHSSKKI